MSSRARDWQRGLELPRGGPDVLKSGLEVPQFGLELNATPLSKDAGPISVCGWLSPGTVSVVHAVLLKRYTAAPTSHGVARLLGSIL